MRMDGDGAVSRWASPEDWLDRYLVGEALSPFAQRLPGRGVEERGVFALSTAHRLTHETAGNAGPCSRRRGRQMGSTTINREPSWSSPRELHG